MHRITFLPTSRIVVVLLCAVIFFVSLQTGTALAHHVTGAGYLSYGHLTSDGNINWCHSGDYSAEGQYAAGTWSAVTPNKLNIYSNCSSVETRTTSVALGVSNPIGYVIICPPVPYVCHNSYTNEGASTNFDTVWTYSESFINTTALGTPSGNTNNRRKTFLHEMGHALTDLAHRSETNAVMRQGILENITPIQAEINLMEAKY